MELEGDEQEITEMENAMFISYEDAKVPGSYLAKLKRMMDETVGEKKYYRYKAWLHYANLDMWQGQGHHFLYMSGDKGGYCTCGLIVSKSERVGMVLAHEVDRKVAKALAHLNLKPVYFVRGHVNLPSLRGKTVALVVDYKWDEDVQKYFWDVICQRCAAFELQILQDAAAKFVKAHNACCKGGA